MSWVRMIRGRGRRIRPLEDNDTAEHNVSQGSGDSVFSNFLFGRRDGYRSQEQRGGSPLKNQDINDNEPNSFMKQGAPTHQSSVINKLSKLITGSEHIVDADNDFEDGKMALFHRAPSDESIDTPRNPTTAVTVPQNIEGQENKSRMGVPSIIGLVNFVSQRDRAFAKTSSNRAVISHVLFDTGQGTQQSRHVHISDKVFGRKGAKLIEDVLGFLPSKLLYLKPFVHMDLAKFRKNQSFVIAVDIVHIGLCIGAYMLIPNNTHEFYLARWAFGMMFSLGICSFFIRLLSLLLRSDKLESVTPYVDIVRFALFGIVFWCTTPLSLYYGTQFYSRLSLCFKSCRSIPFDGVTQTCTREYWPNGTAICTDEIYQAHLFEYDRVNLTSWVVTLFQPTEMIMLAMFASDISEAIKENKLLHTKDEDDEQLDVELDEDAE